MKKILVPTDFSEHANYATEIAASIAKKSQGRIYLMHVIDIPTYVDTHSSTFENVPEGIAALKHTKQMFKEFLKKPYFEGVNVAEVLQFDDVFSNISVFAEQNDIDLIVMGSHGARGLKEFFIGSNTEKIVRTADCPVLTVKKGISDFDVKNLVFASQFTEDSYDAYRKIFKIADYFDSYVHLLKVITKEHFEPHAKSLELINAFVEEMGLKKYSASIYNAENIEQGINEFSLQKNADMVAVTTHGRSNLSQMLSHDSQAEKLVNHSELPILSVKI